jgi:hypothetical protein
MFTAEGEVIHGPATSPLPKAKLPPAPKENKKKR